MLIHRLLYRSDAALVGSPEEIDGQVLAIAAAARKANEAADVTGALLLSSGVFVQVLEGPVDAVERTFERICRDLRHRRVRLLQLAVADERLFADWRMAKVTPTAELARLGPALDAAAGVRLDATKANDAMRMMRDRLLAEDQRPSRLEPVAQGGPAATPDG